MLADKPDHDPADRAPSDCGSRPEGEDPAAHLWVSATLQSREAHRAEHDSRTSDDDEGSNLEKQRRSDRGEDQGDTNGDARDREGLDGALASSRHQRANDRATADSGHQQTVCPRVAVECVSRHQRDDHVEVPSEAVEQGDHDHDREQLWTSVYVANYGTKLSS